MTLWTKKELLAALSDELLEYNLEDGLTIDEVVIDGRKAAIDGLFIALKGENNDGHDFLDQASKNGCRALLIQDFAALEKIKNCQFILVRNSFLALQKLAEFSRKRSRATIITITGSVGKTSVKEMLRLVFATQGKTFASRGNLNNHFGLPLSLCNFPTDCRYGIFEMGMNHLGEIEPLSKLARPHLAVITNVGPVHIENFKNEEEIAQAKAEIFAGLVEDGIALINADNPHFELLKNYARVYKIKEKNIISFGEKKPATYKILSHKIIDFNLAEVVASGQISYKIASSNQSIIFNSIIAISCLSLLGVDIKAGILALKKLENIAGRGAIGEVKIDSKTITIIDDSYNASVLSMRSGLEQASELKKILGKKRLVAALGDMLELGEKSAQLHQEIAKYLQQFHIDFVLLVGNQMAQIAENCSVNFYKIFSDSSLAASEIKNLLQDGDLLYVKGSRGMKMERIIEKLSL